MDAQHDDRTRGGVAPSRASLRSHALPIGLCLEEFELTRVVGQGGFGIVYEAHDRLLDRRVAIKEYMPSSLTSRGLDGLSVAVRSEGDLEAFEIGLRSFVNEARLLARFDHPALVKVHRYWEAHGTAYMAMPFYEGPTLKQELASRAKAPDEETLRGWLASLMEALSVLHAARCLHRDVAPDNILLTAAGPLLLDFGAARRVLGDMSQGLTVVLKPGYAPVEQYAGDPTMNQGPWTDVYALAAVMYRAIAGRPPMPSVERVLEDRLPKLREVAAGYYSDRFLDAIDASLAVRPQERPQDMAALRELLGEPAPRTVATQARQETRPAELPAEPQDIRATSGPSRHDTRATAANVGRHDAEPTVVPSDAPSRPTRTRTASPKAESTSSPRWPYAAIAAAGLLSVLGGWWLAGGGRPAPSTVMDTAPPGAGGAAPTQPSRAETGAPPVQARSTPPDAAPAVQPAPPPLPAPAAALPRTDAQPPPTTREALAAPGAAPKLTADREVAEPPAAAPIAVPVPPPVRETRRRPAAAQDTPPRSAAVSAACTELLQKASLEPLAADEAAFLRKECTR